MKIIIATYGAHEHGINQQNAASFVLCCLDIRRQESIGSEEWTHSRPLTPLLTRYHNLPQHIGVHKSDIAHGEWGAFVMAEMALDADLLRITIADTSAVVCNQMYNARDDNNGDNVLG